MALQELQQDGFPDITIPDGTRTEARLFRVLESELNSLPAYGQAAPEPFISTNPPQAISYLHARRTSKKDVNSNEFVWHVEIHATEASMLITWNSDNSQFEDLDAGSVPEAITTGGQTWLQDLETEIRYRTKRIYTQADIKSANAERKKIGKVNSSAIGGGSESLAAQEWKCIDVIIKRADDRGNMQISYHYQRAPVDLNGNQMTWQTYGASQSPAITYPEADISP